MSALTLGPGLFLDRLVKSKAVSHRVFRACKLNQRISFELGLDWIGLDWIGLDWIGLDLIGLDLTSYFITILSVMKNIYLPLISIRNLHVALLLLLSDAVNVIARG